MHIVLSIDFELRWGVQERLGYDLDTYRRNLEGVRDAAPAMLEVRQARQAKATWASVGALAGEGWDERERRAPPGPSSEPSQAMAPTMAQVALAWRACST